ncbi:MAG: TlpA family protein disulfide reductase [Acidobacteria bacterium]|nr:TlpA family protein disulfide reductase [Acidobacteriota bacterium]MCL5287382.1 TlpA family protein disulfide reductase [Acidobacteriota bacterium]
MTKVLAGHVAPAFTLPAVAGGKTFSLADALKKGPVVVAFFKVSCPVCQFTFPFLERLYQAHRSDAVTFVGISQNEGAQTKEFLAEYGITFTGVTDLDGYPVSNSYGLNTVPTVFLIAPDGKVQVSSVGFGKADLEKIAKELGAYFQKKPARVFLPTEIVPDYKPG